jgi:hypothetical protein
MLRQPPQSAVAASAFVVTGSAVPAEDGDAASLLPKTSLIGRGAARAHRNKQPAASDRASIAAPPSGAACIDALARTNTASRGPATGVMSVRKVRGGDFPRATECLFWSAGRQRFGRARWRMAVVRNGRTSYSGTSAYKKGAKTKGWVNLLLPDKVQAGTYE